MSAYEIPGFLFSLPSATDFSVKATTGQFRFVDVNNVGSAVVPTADGGQVIGVRQNLPKVGEATTIMVTGISFVEASAAIAVGANVSTTVNGRAVTSIATKAIAGRALTAATAAGQYITVLLGTSSPVA